MSPNRNNVVLLGEPNVGKSAIIQRLTCNNFDVNKRPTIGVAFKSIDYNVYNLNLKISIWDTSGRSAYSKLLPYYCQNPSAALIVYDVSDRHSFNRVDNWISFLRKNCLNKTIIIIVGNKVDIRKRFDNKCVTYKEGVDFALDKNVPFFETSAKTDLNINEIFKDISTKMLTKSLITRNYLVEQKYKVIIIGDSGVGKSCLIERLFGRKFPQLIAPTFEADFQLIEKNYNNENIKLDLWDTCNHERYQSMLPMVFRGADAAILVYSIIDENSFKNLRHWLILLEKLCETKIPIILLGNKCDLEKERQVDNEDYQYLIDSNTYIRKIIEVSAKYDKSLELILQYLLNELLNLNLQNLKKSEDLIIIKDKGQKCRNNCFLNSILFH